MSPSKPTPRVFLIANAEKSGAAESSRHLARWLESEGMLAGVDLQGRPESVNEAKADFVIALGGDGTILYAGQAMQDRQVPIIGVNMGKLGYLANFDVEELRRHWAEIVATPDLIERRLMFDVRLVSSGEERWRGVALNDCVVRVGDPFRTVSLEIQIDDRPLCTLVGDGVILATPTGSTAHNLSCGGPIVEPGVEAIILTPKCPHSFTYRPVLVAPSSRVCVRLLAREPGRHHAAAVLDGQRVEHFGDDCLLYVSRSSQCFQLVRNPNRTSWNTLITKLKWGQDVS